MLTGTSTLPPDEADEFYFYAPDAVLLEVQVNGDGPWHPTSREADVNGTLGFRVDLAGPDAVPPPGAVVLQLGYNRFTVRVDGTPQDGGRVYVGSASGWIDLYDPVVYSTIVTGRGDPAAVVPDPFPFQVETALAVATGVLASLTAGLVHTAGSATDEFRAGSWPHRLALQHRPVVEVLAVSEVDTAGVLSPLAAGTWQPRRDGVTVTAGWPPPGVWGVTARPPILGCEPGGVGVVLRVDYRFGSTVSPAARNALLYLARQYYLRAAGQSCELPSRTTNLTREGVSISIDAEQGYLDQGRTGVGVVDQWITTLSPGGRRRARAGVYTDGAPPAVTVDYRASM